MQKYRIIVGKVLQKYLHKDVLILLWMVRWFRRSVCNECSASKEMIQPVGAQVKKGVHNLWFKSRNVISINPLRLYI